MAIQRSADAAAGEEGRNRSTRGLTDQKSDRQNRLPWKNLVGAAASFILLFGVYELLEHVWLVDALPMETLHTLHVLRGIAGALIVSAILLAPQLFGRGTSAYPSDAETADMLVALRDRTLLRRSHIAWLVRMRWVAVVIVGALSVVATHVVHVLASDRLVPLLGAAAVLALGNSLFARRVQGTEKPRAELWRQILFDLLVLTFLLQQSGGIENPMFFAYSFHVVIAGIFLSTTEAFAVATIASLLLFGTTFAEALHVIPHYAIALTPHPHDVHGVSHPAFDTTFALGRVGTAVLAFQTLAGLTTMVARELLRREEQLVQAISSDREAQQQLVRAGKMAAIGELAGRVAHEINNPVGIMLAKLDLLREKKLSPETDAELKKIIELGRRASGIVKRLLSFARYDISSPPQPARTAIRLEVLVQNAVELLSPMLSQHEINLEVDIEPGLAPIVGSPDELSQVLVNLLNNAAQAMPNGGELRVELERARGDPPMQVVRISDTGVGIAADIRQRIFEPFFSTKPAGQGTGLGLPISVDIARDHGGTIELESGPAGGAQFALFLPEAPTEARNELEQ